MLTGKTKNLAVIGCPIEHSLSPLMHNAALAEAGLDYVYIALPIAPENLKTAIAGIKAAGFCGFNVTLPHKTAIMELLDELDKSAYMIGAVNTVAVQNGRWIGYNTDCSGFIKSLQSAQIVVKNQNAVLLGAGGAASAVIWGLIENGIKKITLAVRDPLKASERMGKFQRYAAVEVVDWNLKMYENALQECDILINCTPLGMSPKIDAMPQVYWDALKRTAAVCDLIYTPAETKFLRSARLRGHITLNGEGMLIEQGAAAFKLWTGKYPDTQIMRRELQKALQKNGL